MSLVVFDFDNTLVDGDAGVLFARHFTAKRYRRALGLSPFEAARELTRLNATALKLLATGAGVHVGYELGQLDRREMVEHAYRGFEGLDADAARDALETFARGKLVDRVREDIAGQLEHHVDRGDRVAIISTGLHELIWPLQDELGWDVEVVATHLDEEDGRLTGRAEGPLDGAEKLTRVKALANRNDLSLEDAWAYGDHEDDAVILERVGNPVAVHPTARLLLIARKRGWTILH